MFECFVARERKEKKCFFLSIRLSEETNEEAHEECHMIEDGWERNNKLFKESVDYEGKDKDRASALEKRCNIFEDRCEH